jgi:hypothetical protein
VTDAASIWESAESVERFATREPDLRLLGILRRPTSRRRSGWPTEPLVPGKTVRVELEKGRRVVLNALYKKLRPA